MLRVVCCVLYVVCCVSLVDYCLLFVGCGLLCGVVLLFVDC